MLTDQIGFFHLICPSVQEHRKKGVDVLKEVLGLSVPLLDVY